MHIYRVELLKTYLVKGDSKEEINKIANNWAAKEMRENDAATVTVNVTEVNNKIIVGD